MNGGAWYALLSRGAVRFSAAVGATTVPRAVPDTGTGPDRLQGGGHHVQSEHRATELCYPAYSVMITARRTYSVKGISS